DFGNDKYRTMPDLLKREADAEAEHQRFVAESSGRVGPRCPACGNLGSLEEIDGGVRCIDCDEAVAATQPLGGLARQEGPVGSPIAAPASRRTTAAILILRRFERARALRLPRLPFPPRGRGGRRPARLGRLLR